MFRYPGRPLLGYGAVITQAGDHPKVAGLVYIAAFEPDHGESALKWFQTARPAAENGVLPPDDKGVVYYDQAKFHAGFCGDLSEEESEFMYASQGAFQAKCFISPITDAAWRTKPAFIRKEKPDNRFTVLLFNQFDRPFSNCVLYAKHKESGCRECKGLLVPGIFLFGQYPSILVGEGHRQSPIR
jgi:hypothetical protein